MPPHKIKLTGLIFYLSTISKKQIKTTIVKSIKVLMLYCMSKSSFPRNTMKNWTRILAHTVYYENLLKQISFSNGQKEIIH